jgi:hypothetical protein
MPEALQENKVEDELIIVEEQPHVLEDECRQE